MKKNYLLTVIFIISFISFSTNAQQDVFSRSDAGTGDWGSANEPWYYQTSNNNQGDPDNDNTIRNFIKIGHNNNTTMTTNGRYYRFETLDFQTGASSQRTINNSSGGLSASGGIYNLSTATHTFNTPIGIDGATVQLNANSSGGLTFTETIFINANTVNFGGSGSGNIIVNGTIQGTGNVNKTGGNTLTISGSNTYSGTTTVSAGTMVLNSNIIDSDVTVNNGATLQISENATISSLTINAGGIVIIDTSKSLTISNNFTNNGSATAHHGSSLLVGGTSTGDITYNVDVTDTDWHLISSPVDGEQYDDAWVTANGIVSGSNNNRGISTYDNDVADTNNGGSDTATGHWRYFQADDVSASTFEAGVGYSLKGNGSDDYSFTGAIQNDAVSPKISQGATNWNLIGNPYAAYLDIDLFLAENTTTNNVLAPPFQAIYVWNGSGYDPITADDDSHIYPGQAFFCKL
ncbi:MULTISPECIES: autotransporter-associated beta strand repeat-containing protein [unclassified Polaribacter]|uniref:autotransporter-associated beta strand repeat-containing protein n=1 Tax=unclassified Polaribacter TaxID=196858 RepID=UPI0011BEC33D|nr:MULTISPECIES: autotransporter-associated beta strand repeat-containing protein [unclassified Polaribacter]TXD50369.1 hypothetical protein ES043_16265 [Polaribacter sp. IC063]TXD56465.1 hypothetical protein ES044_16690 [Polaribacter sp. IC066]